MVSASSWQAANVFGSFFRSLYPPKGRMPAVGREAQAVPLPRALVGCGGSTLRTLQGSKCKLGIQVVVGMGLYIHLLT